MDSTSALLTTQNKLFEPFWGGIDSLNVPEQGLFSMATPSAVLPHCVPRYIELLVDVVENIDFVKVAGLLVCRMIDCIVYICQSRKTS